MRSLVSIILFLFGIFQTESSWAQNTRINAYDPGEGIDFKSKNGHSLKLTAYLQPMYEARLQTIADGNLESRFRLRRARMRFDGNLKNDRFSYRFQFDLTGNGELEEQNGQFLIDGVVSYRFFRKWEISFGQRATYTDNRELLMLSNTLQLVDRSRLTSAFASIREFGFFVDGQIRPSKNSYLKPYFVLTNGDGGNVFNNDFGGLKIGGRLDYLPFGLFTKFGQFRQVDMIRELTPKLVIGANFSQNYGMSSRRGRESGAILYLNDLDEITLPNFTKYGVDLLFKFKGFSLLAEYLKTQASVPENISKRIRNDGSIATIFVVDGVENVENYVKSRMMLGSGYNVQAGYLFKSGLSIDARYTHLRADTYSFLNNETFYNRPDTYTLGFSQYLRRNYSCKVQADFSFVPRSQTSSSTAENEFIARIMLTYTL